MEEKELYIWCRVLRSRLEKKYDRDMIERQFTTFNQVIGPCPEIIHIIENPCDREAVFKFLTVRCRILDITENDRLCQSVARTGVPLTTSVPITTIGPHPVGPGDPKHEVRDGHVCDRSLISTEIPVHFVFDRGNLSIANRCTLRVTHASFDALQVRIPGMVRLAWFFRLVGKYGRRTTQACFSTDCKRRSVARIKEIVVTSVLRNVITPRAIFIRRRILLVEGREFVQPALWYLV